MTINANPNHPHQMPITICVQRNQSYHEQAELVGRYISFQLQFAVIFMTPFFHLTDLASDVYFFFYEVVSFAECM
jgi:hypothetical protein